MSLAALLRVAMRALAVNKLRSSLTMLGIIIGVGAVIVMIAVGGGGQARVEEQIRSLGSNLLLILSGTRTQSGVRLGSGSNFTLSEDDAIAINREIPEAVAAPALRGGAQVVWGNSNWATQIYGTTNEVVEALGHLGPMTIGDLGKKMLVTGGCMTVIIDNLERDGLVERIRSTEDRRVIKVGLTAKGNELFLRIFRQDAARITELASVLSEEEQRQLSYLLKKLGLALKEVQ